MNSQHITSDELKRKAILAVTDSHLKKLQEKHPIDTVETLGPVAADTAAQLVEALIKKHELDAAINENEYWRKRIGEHSDEDTSYYTQRIAELKAEREAL